MHIAGKQNKLPAREVPGGAEPPDGLLSDYDGQTHPQDATRASNKLPAPSTTDKLNEQSRA